VLDLMVMSCSLVYRYRRFGGPCYCHVPDKSVEALPYMEFRHFISEANRGSTVTRNVRIYRKITFVVICSVIRTENTLKKMWNILCKDVVHIVTTVLSSSVSRVRICDFLLNMNPFVCGHYVILVLLSLLLRKLYWTLP
jgi:hypothetical protein